jgi:hypothetical protein
MNRTLRLYQKAYDAIASEPGLITDRYFDDLKQTDNCPVCALGALIRALPDDARREAMAAFSAAEATLRIPGSSPRPTSFNRARIDADELAPVLAILRDHYGLSAKALGILQRANDRPGDGEQRKHEVLEELYHIDNMQSFWHV